MITPEKSEPELSEKSISSATKPKFPWHKSLKFKAAITAVILSTVPAATVGVITFKITQENSLEQLNLAKKSQTVESKQQKKLWLPILLLSAGAVAVTSLIAIKFAMQAVEPIMTAAEIIKDIGRGQLDTRLIVEGEDEISYLAHQVNLMLDKVEALLVEQESTISQQKELTSQQQKQKETIQAELLQLLGDVEGVSQGDLTLRAEINEGEIGIVADFFNSIIENLRDIVDQVKTAATQVNVSVGENEHAIGILADEAMNQATRVDNTLDSLEKMTSSIQAVAENARSAANVAHKASSTAEISSTAMEKTVETIMQLRNSVEEAAEKVRNLGKASDKISKVITLINQIALKTNYLAVNASIEASRAGEEGQGFAVVAQEVGQLASQSAKATKEIEQILANIQQETKEVVQAMKNGTVQVSEGTRLVEESKAGLASIFTVSRQIDQLLQLISQETTTQVNTSQTVSELMKEVAGVSSRTSDSSRQVSKSLQETVAIALELQSSVGKFKTDK
ncbi:MAG: methyl-accepting chemotaxis protein [Cyanobacteria bacterium J083]|nr:MAG: methyl-accepting chemotaxis protein [Cyanobacteria bacterium J083]